MRVGYNPNVHASIHAPSIAAAVITHLPNREGYHQGRFAVVERCFQTLQERAGRELPLYVWDNGSDRDFLDWLYFDLRPEWLTLSANIGKANARAAIARAFPGRTILCVSDDDIYYEEGWLDPQLELLRGFPNVGVVSGCPIRSNFRWGTASTLRWAEQNAVIKKARFIPDRWEYDFARSIGHDYNYHLEQTAGDVDYLIEYGDLRAYATAHHMQMVGYAGRIAEASEWGDRAMRQEQRFDMTMDSLGYLRLTTTERYTRHIGNMLEQEFVR